MKHLLTAAILAGSATLAHAEPVKYTLDPAHSQVVFTYEHLGFSTTTGMFTGFEGEIMFDQENPENSSVNVSLPIKSMMTGWEKRDEHFMSDDFFGAADGDMVTFKSTSINVTDEDEAEITGDLTMNGVTKSVVLEAELNKTGQHPMAGKEWAGFDAETTIKRSDFGVDKFAPNVSDEVEIDISIEAMAAE